MNRRFLLPVLILLLCFSLILVSGCSKKNSAPMFNDVSLQAGQTVGIPDVFGTGEPISYTLAPEGIVDIQNNVIYAMHEGETTVTMSCGKQKTSFKVSVTGDAYRVTLENDNTMGTVTGLESGLYAADTILDMNVTANVGYEVDSILVNGEPTTLANCACPLTANEDLTVQVKYKKVNYAVTVAQTQGGTVSGVESKEYPSGQALTLQVTPNKGFVAGVTLNGVPAELTDNKLALTVTEKTEIQVTFTNLKYKLTIQNDESKGTLHGITAGSHDAYTTATVWIVPKGTWIPSIKVNGVLQNTPAHAFRLSLTADTTISVSYYDSAKRASDSVLAARRDIVEANGAKSSGALFIYDKDLIHENDTRFNLQANVIHRGIPYNAGCMNLDSYMLGVEYTDADGVNHINTDLYMGKWGFLYGASCADLVYWAWSEVSTSISFGYAQQMNEVHGCMKVGTYESTVKNGLYVDTFADVANNGKTVMYEAYAKLLKGDGGVFYFKGDEKRGAGGHGILIADVKVVRNADGSINPKDSHILYHDTNGGYHDTTFTVNGKEVPGRTAGCHYGWKSFETMFKEGYLPVTCRELMYPSAPVAKLEVVDSLAGKLDFNAVIDGVIHSNYYASYYTMEITDAAGNVVQKATRYTNEDHMDFKVSYFGSRYNLDWSSDTSSKYRLYGADDVIKPDYLNNGKYHCKLTAYFGNHESVVVRDFDFTV